jgi:hypothetical protein
MAGGPVRQPYAGVDFIPLSGIYEFGYISISGNWESCFVVVSLLDVRCGVALLYAVV